MEMRTIVFIILVVALFFFFWIKNLGLVANRVELKGISDRVKWAIVMIIPSVISTAIPSGLAYLIFM